MGLRFLFPVYLINSVEVTVGEQMSDATTTKSNQILIIFYYVIDIRCTLAKGFLQSIGKSSFVRVPRAYPRKLTEKEAFNLEMQIRTQSNNIIIK